MTRVSIATVLLFLILPLQAEEMSAKCQQDGKGPSLSVTDEQAIAEADDGTTLLQVHAKEHTQLEENSWYPPAKEFAPRPACWTAMKNDEACISNPDVKGCADAGWDPAKSACHTLIMGGKFPCTGAEVASACGLDEKSMLLSRTKFAHEGEHKDEHEEDEAVHLADAAATAKAQTRRRRRWWQALYSWR